MWDPPSTDGGYSSCCFAPLLFSKITLGHRKDASKGRDSQAYTVKTSSPLDYTCIRYDARPRPRPWANTSVPLFNRLRVLAVQKPNVVAYTRSTRFSSAFHPAPPPLKPSGIPKSLYCEGNRGIKWNQKTAKIPLRGGGSWGSLLHMREAISNQMMIILVEGEKSCCCADGPVNPCAQFLLYNYSWTDLNLNPLLESRVEARQLERSFHLLRHFVSTLQRLLWPVFFDLCCIMKLGCFPRLTCQSKLNSSIS